jgi:hypothetical protein
MKTEVEALAFVVNLATQVWKHLAEPEKQKLHAGAELSPMSLLELELSLEDVGSMLDKMVKRMGALPAQLRFHRFKPSVLPPYRPNDAGGETGSDVAGSYRHMQTISRTQGGFYTVLHMFEVAFRNLASMAKEPERSGQLLGAAAELRSFAEGALQFYKSQLQAA